MTYKTGWMKKIIDGVSTKVFAFAHVKTVYYDYKNSKTLKTKLDEMDNSISDKAPKSHTHDDRYYTESEVDEKLKGKANSTHNHSKILDSGNSKELTFAYSKSGITPSDFTSLACWKESELRCIDKAFFATANHNHSKILDSNDSRELTFAYSKAGIIPSDFTSLACWKGSELRGVDKSFFATSDHTHTASEVGAQPTSKPHFTGSFRFGIGVTASDSLGVAFGYDVHAMNFQMACGHYNNINTAKDSVAMGNGDGTSFVVGNGYVGSSGPVASNAFRVNDNGQTYAQKAYTTQGCDYAEYYEWLDENTDAEDRRGYFVTLDGEKIKIANPGDFVLGIVSAWPSVIGNGDEDWLGRYILDDFGARIPETFEYETEEYEIITNDDGEEKVITKKVKKTGTKWKENPAYDPDMEYIQRSNRPEWNAVGMLGVLAVRDDGTCKVNGFCTLADGGIATASDKGYRVVKRVTDNIVKVIFNVYA